MRALTGAVRTCVCMFALCITAACSKKVDDSTPEGAVTMFLRALDDTSRDPTASGRAVALLDPQARTALAERAARATSIGGKQRAPESMLAPVWSPPRFSVDHTSTALDGDGAHAMVDLYGVDPATQHVRVPVVREGDRWRIVVTVPPS